MGLNSATTPDAQERELFLAVLELDPSRRAGYLSEVCRDVKLRERVTELLAEQEQLGGFLESPAASGLLHDRKSAAVMMETAGDRIGRYKLLQQVGEGGCGVVYMAEQEEPVRRRVALKIIKAGMDTKNVIARFEAERQALAMMDHPNIAKVLDAGATETGRPFFVMELVRGVRITEYCDENNLPTYDRLKLFIQVCQAIQHAHQKGIIHRDIKPSNILITMIDGAPIPKVIDFGIAKATEQRLTEKTLFTEFTTFIGTPAYMSPEQAAMGSVDIDTRSDIYALGVLLYELLTGAPPFDSETLAKAGLDECRRTILETEPERPSTRLAGMVEEEKTTTARCHRTDPPRLLHSLRGDLDWIVMRALEKERARRYPTANALAGDVQRYLDGEPVLARPPSALYRLQKVAKRHRAAFTAAAVVAISLMGAVAVSSWQAVRARSAERIAIYAQQQEADLRKVAEQQRARAEQESALARLNEYVADINLAKQSLDAGNYGRAAQLLNKHSPEAGAADLRGFEWRYLWHLAQGDEHETLLRQNGAVQSLSFSPDGSLIAIGMRELPGPRFRFASREKFTIWDLRSKSLLTNVPQGAASLAFLPNGARLASAGTFGVRVWKTSDWSGDQLLPDSSGPVAVSRDGTLMATASRGGVKIWETATWSEKTVLADATAPFAFSPDGKRLASDSKEGLCVWSIIDAARVVLEDSTNVFLPTGWQRTEALAFSPDGKSIVAGRNALSQRGVFVLSVWDANTGKEIATMPDDPEHVEHTGAISSVAFSPDGKMLATASVDYSIRLWNFSTRQALATLQGHMSEVRTIAFSPDGQTLVSGAKDGTVNLWQVKRPVKPPQERSTWQPAAISRDGKLMAGLNRQGTVGFFNVATRAMERQIQLEGTRFRNASSISFSEDLMRLAYALDDGSAKVWNPQANGFDTIKISEGPLDVVTLSPDGKSLLGVGRGRRLFWWDLVNGTNTAMSTDVRRVLFSRDGQTMASVHWNGRIQIWAVAQQKVFNQFSLDTPFPSEAALSQDGSVFAAAGNDDVIRLFSTATGKQLGSCVGHKQAVYSLAFSRDGKTLASAGDDSTLKFWNVATQQELLNIRQLGGALRSLLFSPSGDLLVAGGSFSQQSGGLRYFPAPEPAKTIESTDDF